MLPGHMLMRLNVSNPLGIGDENVIYCKVMLVILDFIFFNSVVIISFASNTHLAYKIPDEESVFNGKYINIY